MLLIICGNSGVGKTWLANQLPLERITTTTTREPRDRETDYEYANSDDFMAASGRGELVACSYVFGNWYGVPYSEVGDGKSVILDDIGMTVLRTSCLDVFGEDLEVVSVLLDCESRDTRGRDDIPFSPCEFDYVFKSGEEALETLTALIEES